MDSTQPRPVALWNQRCDPALVPRTGTDASEDARLRAAVTWAYEYILFQYAESYSFSGAIYLNDASPHLDQFDVEKQFEVVEDVQGIERTLRIRSAQSNYSLDSLEILPLESHDQSLEFSVLGASSSERTIRYSDIRPAALKIRLGNLHAPQIHSARACAHSEGVPPMCFPEPLNASIERSGVSDTIQIDKLKHASGNKRGLEEHLTVLFDNLFNNGHAHNIGMRFDYSYHLTESGFEVSVPVRIMPPQVYSGDYAEAASATVRDWYESASLPPGVFKIGLNVYRRETSQIILNLERLLLPVDTITDL
jgi:hypothetical protein